jgi:predicted transglutaminase-like cysteine proteinase
MKNWAKIVLLAVLLAALPSAVNAAESFSLFNTVAYKNESLVVLPQWQRVLNEIDAEKQDYSTCIDTSDPCSPRALLAWQAMIRGQSGQSKMAQLRAVNRFVNQWTPITDIDNHQQQDFWSSPLTFLRRSGDCEDYAIIKYVSLREMGFEAEQLRIVVVRDTLRELAHAVLAVQHEGETFILDNLNQAVLPQTKVRQYLPYYSVNEQARWAHLPPDSLMLSSTEWSVMPSATAIGEGF